MYYFECFYEVTGSSLIDNIGKRIMLAANCCGVEEDKVKVNISNNSKNIEKMIIAVVASLGKYHWQTLSPIFWENSDLFQTPWDQKSDQMSEYQKRTHKSVRSSVFFIKRKHLIET